MASIFVTVLVVLLVIVAIALLGGLFVLLAYGVAWILTQFLPFSIFEATLLDLIGLSAIVIIAVSIIRSVIQSPPPSAFGDFGGDWADDELDWDSDDELDDVGYHPGVPRWRRSSKPIRVPKVDPDERCPCGSGRKYKNCHGGK